MNHPIMFPDRDNKTKLVSVYGCSNVAKLFEKIYIFKKKYV